MDVLMSTELNLSTHIFPALQINVYITKYNKAFNTVTETYWLWLSLALDMKVMCSNKINVILAKIFYWQKKYKIKYTINEKEKQV